MQILSKARGWSSRVASLAVAGALGSGCGGGFTEVNFDLLPQPPLKRATVTSSATAFCCDPAGPFPQVVGTMTFTNDGNATAPVQVQFQNGGGVLLASPPIFDVPAGESVTVSILADSCPDPTASIDVIQKDGPQVLDARRLRVVSGLRCDELDAIVDFFLYATTDQLDAYDFLAGLVGDGIALAVLHSAIAVGSNVTSDPHTEISLAGVCAQFFLTGELAALFGGGAVEARAATLPGLPCGAGPNGFTVCPPTPAPLPQGEYLLVWLATQGAIPLAHPTDWYQYGFVFDADGNPANNYVPAPAFANDFYGGTDRWYSVEYTPAGGWALLVTDARGNVFTPMPSAARAVIVGNAIALMVPRSEFDDPTPDYRVTTFRHGGNYGIPGPPHVWSGDVFPAVALGLLAFPGSP